MGNDNGLELNKLYHMDCMDGMKHFPDKFFELAIVDPPYGIEKAFSPSSHIAKYGQTVTVNDMKPAPDYFAELFRVSKNQIIWGYNHLSDMLPKCKGFVFWHKHQPLDSFADGELAWTSFNKNARCFDYPFFGTNGADHDYARIHPTQKPVALYAWLLNNYAKPGDKILDTHVGSASSLIACYRLDHPFIGFEIDRDYYAAAQERLRQEMAQYRLF